MNSSFEELFYDFACTVTLYTDPDRPSRHNDSVTVYEFVWRLRQHVEVGRHLTAGERDLLLKWIERAASQRGPAVRWVKNAEMEGISSQCVYLLLACQSTMVGDLQRVLSVSKGDHEILRRIARHASATVDLWREIAATNQHPRVLSFFNRNRIAKADPVLRGYIALHVFDKEPEPQRAAPPAGEGLRPPVAHDFLGGVCARCGRDEAMARRFNWPCK